MNSISLSRVFLDVNGKKEYEDYLMFQYPARHKRKVGCFGSGEMHMYSDSNGNASAYLFCQTKLGNCIDQSIKNTILKIQKKGCPVSQDIQIGMYDT